MGNKLIEAQRLGRQVRKKVYLPAMRSVTHLRTAPRGSAQRRTAAKILRYLQMRKNRSVARMASQVSKATAKANAAPRLAAM